MNHHSDQQTVRTNFDLSVLKIQRRFRMFCMSLSQFLSRSPSFSLSLAHSFATFFYSHLHCELWLVGRQKKIKLSFDLWAGTGVLLVHTSDALLDVHIRRLNLCFAAAFPLDHNEFRMKHLLESLTKLFSLLCF